jgi:hypothetical protein
VTLNKTIFGIPAQAGIQKLLILDPLLREWLRKSAVVTELLEQHFDTTFAAPDGIAKLRELILTLGMQMTHCSICRPDMVR